MGSSPSTLKKNKDKTPQKRKNSRKLDRDTLSLPVANSQFYTAAISYLTPIAQTPVERDEKENVTPSTAPVNPNTPVFELTEELTPKRPLRSEVEREKRLSRTQSVITTASNSTSNGNGSKVDNASVSGDSSGNSRHSIISLDSRTSEDEPPVLPPKHGRDSDCGLNSIEESQYSHARMSGGHLFSNRPLPATPDSLFFRSENSCSHYEVLEIKNREVINTIETKMAGGKKSAPVPPPKPSRKSNHPMSP